STHGGKFRPSMAETHDDAAGNRLTSMVAGPLNPRARAAIPHGKSFACRSIEVGFALRGSIERGVADEDRIFGVEDDLLRWENNNFAAGQPLPEVVVRFTFQR